MLNFIQNYTLRYITNQKKKKNLKYLVICLNFKLFSTMSAKGGKKYDKKQFRDYENPKNYSQKKFTHPNKMSLEKHNFDEKKPNQHSSQIKKQMIPISRNNLRLAEKAILSKKKKWILNEDQLKEVKRVSLLVNWINQKHSPERTAILREWSFPSIKNDILRKKRKIFRKLMVTTKQRKFLTWVAQRHAIRRWVPIVRKKPRLLRFHPHFAHIAEERLYKVKKKDRKCYRRQYLFYRMALTNQKNLVWGHALYQKNDLKRLYVWRLLYAKWMDTMKILLPYIKWNKVTRAVILKPLTDSYGENLMQLLAIRPEDDKLFFIKKKVMSIRKIRFQLKKNKWSKKKYTRDLLRKFRWILERTDLRNWRILNYRYFLRGLNNSRISTGWGNWANFRFLIGPTGSLYLNHKNFIIQLFIWIYRLSLSKYHDARHKLLRERTRNPLKLKRNWFKRIKLNGIKLKHWNFIPNSFFLLFRMFTRNKNFSVKFLYYYTLRVFKKKRRYLRYQKKALQRQVEFRWLRFFLRGRKLYPYKNFFMSRTFLTVNSLQRLRLRYILTNFFILRLKKIFFNLNFFFKASINNLKSKYFFLFYLLNIYSRYKKLLTYDRFFWMSYGLQWYRYSRKTLFNRRFIRFKGLRHKLKSYLLKRKKSWKINKKLDFRKRLWLPRSIKRRYKKWFYKRKIVGISILNKAKRLTFKINTHTGSDVFLKPKINKVRHLFAFSKYNFKNNKGKVSSIVFAQSNFKKIAPYLSFIFKKLNFIAICWIFKKIKLNGNISLFLKSFFKKSSIKWYSKKKQQNLKNKKQNYLYDLAKNRLYSYSFYSLKKNKRLRKLKKKRWLWYLGLKKGKKPRFLFTQDKKSIDFFKKKNSLLKSRNWYTFNLLFKRYMLYFFGFRYNVEWKFIKKLGQRSKNKLENTVSFFESRLLNVLLRANLVPNIAAFFYLIKNNRIFVNFKLLKNSSYIMKPYDFVYINFPDVDNWKNDPWDCWFFWNRVRFLDMRVRHYLMFRSTKKQFVDFNIKNFSYFHKNIYGNQLVFLKRPSLFELPDFSYGMRSKIFYNSLFNI